MDLFFAKKSCINIFFYGDLASHICMNQIEFRLFYSQSIADIKQSLADLFDSWQSFHQPIYQAINRELVTDNALVNRGDEVAFFSALPVENWLKH